MRDQYYASRHPWERKLGWLITIPNVRIPVNHNIICLALQRLNVVFSSSFIVIKTVWANIGMHQFHLSEGKPDAQVFDGMITLIYDDLEGLMEKYNSYLDDDEIFAPLKETEFLVGMVDDMMLVTDPWGSQFCIIESDSPDEDRAVSTLELARFEMCIPLSFSK